MNNREENQQRVLAAIDTIGRECYSREVAECIPGELRHTIRWVQKELSWLEQQGVLVSRIVKPGPNTFNGGMMRRYYKRDPRRAR